MTQWLAARLELVVAAMLVFLGARVIATVHSKSHEQAGHFHWTRFGIKPIVVGLVHGAAGSAALTLLVLSTISSPRYAILYIAVFGIGSMIGMAAISVLLALPLRFADRKLSAFVRPIQVSAGVFSCAFGLYLASDVWTGLI